MNKKTRRINTRMYGQRAFDILNSLHGQLSDGLWKNAKGYDKYWENFDVKRADDDRVYFEVNPDTRYEYWRGYRTGLIDTKPNPFAGMDDKTFLAWIAKKLKAAIKIEAKDNGWLDGWWSPDCGISSRYLNGDIDATVGDVYTVCDTLLGRNAQTDRGREVVVGYPAPASVVQGRKKLARAKKEAKAIYDARLATLDRQFQAAREKYEADKKALWEDYYNKAKALDPDGAVLI